MQDSGFYGARYERLGIRMHRLEDWLTKVASYAQRVEGGNDSQVD